MNKTEALTVVLFGGIAVIVTLSGVFLIGVSLFSTGAIVLE
ncbi:MAG: hypothetical protein ACOH1J_01105 [Microbacteriaceae bacterium]